MIYVNMEDDQLVERNLNATHGMGSCHTIAFSNCFFYSSAWLGMQLFFPLRQFLEFAVRLTDPFSPYKTIQWRTFGGEIIHRAFYVPYLLVMFVFLVVSSPFAVFFCYLGDLGRKRTVIVYPKNHEGHNLSILPPLLKISTFNVAYMPPFIAVWNGIRPSSVRTAEVIAAINRCNDDIVCLQEAFLDSAMFRTAQNLPQYPYSVLQVGHQTFALGSGLCLLSKYPVENVRYVTHPAKGGVETNANKGVLGVTIRLTTNHVIFVFNTHLNGGAPGGIAALQLCFFYSI